MLLKLIPARQEPTIHFSLCFDELPLDLPTPTAWTSQLAHLMHEDLEVPVTLHSLDRAAGVTCLLEDITLDMEKGEVRCRFIDGSVDNWYFAAGGKVQGDALVDALEGIVRDVKESTLEDERILRDREQEREKDRQRALERSRSMSMSSASRSHGPGKSPKHKRQRSLFMHIVSSIGSIITLTSPPNPSSLPFSAPPSHGPRSASVSNTSAFHSSQLPPPPSPTSLPSPGTSARARALRRAARSALVDTYRRFVLPELVRRFNHVGCTIRVVGNEIEISSDDPQAFGHQLEHQNPEGGGFCVWILHSMRRRALERMQQILEESGVNAEESLTAQMPPWSVVQEPTRIYSSSPDADVQEVPSAEFEPTTMNVPLSFSDDDEEEENTEVDADTKANSDTSETDTDGSSVHTPSTTSHVQCYPRSNNRTSISSSSSSDSASSTSPSSSEGPPATPTDVCPPPPTKDLPTLPLEAQPAEPSDHHSFSLVSHHRRLSLPEHPHPHLPHTGTTSQYPTHRLSADALKEYTQLQGLRTRLGQLVLFAASQARVSADETKSRLEVLAVRSRRRAWSNKALTPVARSVIARANGSADGGSAGSTTLGLATPFRGSPLARYVWSPEDFARDAALGSGSKSSSYGSLSVTFGRSSFPSSRARLRPRIDYEAALAAAVLEPSSGHTEEEEEEDNKLVEREFEIYEEFRGPSPIGGRARRHHRRRCVENASTMRGRGGAAGVGRLFPVSEEMEGEDSQEFVMSLSVQSRGRPRRTLAERTFMGCDEVRVEGCDEDDDFGGDSDFLEDADFEVDDGLLEDARELDLELGLGFGVSAVDSYSGIEGGMTFAVDDADIEGLRTNMDRLEMGFVERPKIRPRVRTSSMMGAFVEKAKGVQRSLQSSGQRLKMPQTPRLQPRQLPQQPPSLPLERNHHRRNANGLTADSILCQPITAFSNVPQPQPQLKTTKAAAAPPFHGLVAPSSPPSPPPMQARKAMDVSRTSTPTPIYTQVEVDMITDDSVQISISGMDEFEPSAAYGIKGAALPLPLPHKALGLPKIPLGGVGPQMDVGYGLGNDGLDQEEFTLSMDLPRRVSCGGRKRMPREGGCEVHYDHQTRRRASFENGRILRTKLGGIFEEAQIPQIQV